MADGYNFQRIVGPLKLGGYVICGFNKNPPVALDEISLMDIIRQMDHSFMLFLKTGLLDVGWCWAGYPFAQRYLVSRKLYNPSPSGWLSERFLERRLQTSNREHELVNVMPLLEQLLDPEVSIKIPTPDGGEIEMPEKVRSRSLTGLIDDMVMHMLHLHQALSSLHDREKMRLYARVMPLPGRETVEAAEPIFIAAHPQGKKRYDEFQSLYQSVLAMKQLP